MILSFQLLKKPDCIIYIESCQKNQEENISEWHKILDHCSIKDIKRLENFAKSFENIQTNHDEINCEVCTLAKQLIVKNKNTVIKANNPLKDIYSDVAGPIDPIGKDGFKCVINFDGHSDCTFCYCIKQKFDTVKATEKFIADVALYGKIKIIRTDNGGE